MSESPTITIMKHTIIIAIIAAATLSACGQSDVSFQTLETARLQARENAEFNAQQFRAAMPDGGNLKMISRGDSSQEPACPQGDGWASIDLIGADRTVKLKCSTVSSAVGCRTDGDFKTSPYAAEDGKCAPTTKVPHPLPKIAK